MKNKQDQTKLVLASASPARAMLLRQSGISFIQFHTDVDERKIESQMRDEGLESAEISQALAEAKALHASQKFSQSCVIGADQVLECEGSSFSKPPDMDSARNQLRRLAGKTHHLVSSAAVVREGKILWSCCDQASLTMRPLSEEFIDHYMGQAGDSILNSVGCYRLEELGAQLFSSIEGNYFTILGLPLLPLLAFLREEKILME